MRIQTDLGGSQPRRIAFRSRRQTYAECLYRKLRRTLEGRDPERDIVQYHWPRPRRAWLLAGRLQRRKIALAPRIDNRLRSPSPAIRAGIWRCARASSRHSHRPTGPIQPLDRTQNWLKLGNNVVLSLKIPMICFIL
jgi:hypothetical protein